jgi:hypothetical protein
LRVKPEPVLVVDLRCLLGDSGADIAASLDRTDLDAFDPTRT